MTPEGSADLSLNGLSRTYSAAVIKSTRTLHIVCNCVICPLNGLSLHLKYPIKKVKVLINDAYDILFMQQQRINTNRSEGYGIFYPWAHGF